MKMREQWYVAVMQNRDEKEGNGRYYNVCMWDRNRKPGARYYKTREDAQKALDNAYKILNGKKQYDANGRREELVDCVNGLGISLVADKRIDDDLRIVKHIIQKRMVTDWETIEEK